MTNRNIFPLATLLLLSLSCTNFSPLLLQADEMVGIAQSIENRYPELKTDPEWQRLRHLLSKQRNELYELVSTSTLPTSIKNEIIGLLKAVKE